MTNAEQEELRGLPPLIDRELIFGNPEITGAQVSPDGSRLAFLRPWKETRNIWVKRVDEPFSAARLLTTETKRPVPGYLWSRDGKYVIYVKDNDGDENFNVFAVDPAAPVSPGTEAPQSRDLTGLAGVRIMLYSVPKNDPDVVFIGVNDRDKSWHDLYKLRISTGERTLTRQNTERVAGWFFDEEGRLRLALRVADNGDQEILRVDRDGFTRVYWCNVFENCAPVRFHKDGRRAYMLTNKGEDVDLTGLVLFDPASGEIEPVESDPLGRVDLTGAVFSEVTGELAATIYVEDHARPYFRDKSFEADYQWLKRELPDADLHFTSRSLDERIWLLTASADTEPGRVYLFDRQTRRLELQYTLWEKLPRASLAGMQIIRYQSSDGLEIPAYLTLPKGVPGKGLPLVVVPHGGPWARVMWGYNPNAQFLANRGYAVLMPNFRGSTGFGKKFLNAGNQEWGRGMQDDITWGVKRLIDEGIADPKRVGIMGGSYGGYATLAGVAFTPDLYRAAVDNCGPSNLATLMESFPPYWEAFQKILWARMANPGTPEGKAWLAERSPLNSVANIRTPLLVVQGANDPRVNRAEAEQIVIALRDHGLPVEYMLAADEGHGYQRPVNNMAMYMAAEKFFAEQLGGRYQEDGTPEVVARLKELMVDPKTVVLSKKLDAAVVETPKPAMELRAGEWKYQAKIELGGREMAMTQSTTVVEDGDAWIATDVMETPAGPATDTARIEKRTLLTKQRTVRQGPMAIEIGYAGGKASGAIHMNGNETKVASDLGGPVFADGPGGRLAIGCLPLAEGYAANFRNFDLQKQKVKLMRLKVAGSETVTVPAGTFEAFKVEVTGDDASAMTVWIAKESRAAVKIAASMPSMGGALMTAELVA